MEFRFLGNSGLKVSAISYGNRVTHGSQVEADQATACVRAAAGGRPVPRRSTHGHVRNGRAETLLGDALVDGEHRPSEPGNDPAGQHPGPGHVGVDDGRGVGDQEDHRRDP